MAGKSWDVVVVGAGNAAFCAALAARENGASVLMVERAPKELMGGNSRFTAGAFRCVYDGVDDLKAIMPDLTADEIDRSDFGTYTTDQFYDDMFRITNYRTDGDLCDRLVGRSRDAMRWLHGKGMKFDPIWGRQAYLIDGKFKFWGGLTVEAKGGGPGLVEQHLKLAQKQGIEIVYGTRAFELIYDGNVVRGVKVKVNGAIEEIKLQVGGDRLRRLRVRAPRCAPSISAPAGSSPRCAARPTTPATASTWRWRSARRAFGNWSGSHAVQWDYNAPEFGDLSVGDNFQKHSYPWGILINATGRRFVDEGADFRNYTYAKYGAVVLRQPNNFAWQVFDGKIVPMLRDEYRIKRVSKVVGQHHRGVRPQARGRQRRGVPRRDQEVQRRGEEGRPVQSEHQGRPLHRRARRQQVELGQHHRGAAVRGLSGRLRRVVLVRRRADRSGHRAGDRLAT